MLRRPRFARVALERCQIEYPAYLSYGGDLLTTIRLTQGLNQRS